MFKKKPKSFVKKKSFTPPPEVTRVRLPRNEETLAVVEQRLGASRVKARCLDGKTRICRIPGRLKKNLWVREGNYVIIQPWEFGGDEKGDIIYKYNLTQAKFLKNKGHLKKIDDLDEF
jgi:translation initiation factor 1A